jgi:hypothetical protein
MESSDNKTPRAVSGRPSLLNTPAGTPPANHSHTRMLDSLERDGKTAASVSARSKPSRKKYGIAALAAVLCAGVGAFLAFGSFDDASASMAAVPPPHVIPVTAAVPAASTAVASAASAPASAQIELAAASAQAPASPAAIAIAETAAASQPHSNPLDKLAAIDAEPASAPVAAATHSSKQDKPHAKNLATAKAHQESVATAKSTTPRAEARAAAPHKTRKSEEDADTELVAAVIARLDKRGANPPAVAPVSATNIESQVHQCASGADLLEARQCRNRACEGHWGKLDACPAARAPKSSRSDGAVNGQHG